MPGPQCRLPPGVQHWGLPSVLASCEATWGGLHSEGTGSPRFICPPRVGIPGGETWGARLPALSPPAPGQVEHMTRHLEDSERAMQERVQRLEAARLSLEEVSWVPGSGGWVCLEGVPGQGPRMVAAVTVCGVGAEPGEGRGTQ